MKLSYISNIKLSEASGGVSGKNHATYHQLKRIFEITDYSCINPKSDILAKFISKYQSIFGLKRNYQFFSNHRLNKINKQFGNSKKSGDIYFFLGFTSWIHINPETPYYCYNDASFATYVDIFNNKKEFLHRDLERIYNKEKVWLENAEKVFFTSNWALQQTKKSYRMPGNNFINIGVGGFIDLPKKDKYTSGFNFLFISREFVPKGGAVVAKAFTKVKAQHPKAQLWIVGDTPPEEILDQDGVVYKGFFNKSIQAEYAQLIKSFEQAFCLVHPTIKDTTTLVISELAYFGCPAIASNKFAIPEFVLPKKSGLLIDNPNDYFEVADKMCYMIENHKEYSQMREFTRQNAIENNTWDKVGERLLNHMK